MAEVNEIYEYELIDIEFELPYELPEEEITSFVREDVSGVDIEKKEQEIEYDADGIPIGHSKEDTVIRRKIIFNFIQKWRTDHQDNPRVFNENLNEYIKMNQTFMIESVEHAATNYKSTKAVLNMEYVMTNAKKVALTMTKAGNRNQKPFEQMVILRYSSEELGIVKFTVGIRRITKEKIAYSITVPNQEKPFVDEAIRIKEKSKGKKRRKKRSI